MKKYIISFLFIFITVYTNVLTYTQLTRLHEREIEIISERSDYLSKVLKDTESLLRGKSLEIHKLVNTIDWMKQEREHELLADIEQYISVYYKKSAPIAKEIARNILDKSKKYDLPALAIVGVMETESEFKPTAVSKKGARGLMQINYAVWKDTFRISKAELHDIDTNIDIGAYILKHYLKVSDQNMQQALYKYVGGDSEYYRRVYVNLAKFHIFRVLNK